MGTPEQVPPSGSEAPTGLIGPVHELRSPAPPITRAPRRSTLLLAIALVVVGAAVSGGSVYWWQHAQASDRAGALAAAVEQADRARREVASLRAQVTGLTGQMERLRAEVAGVEARVSSLRAQRDRLRARVAEVQRQLDVKPSAACAASAMLPVIQAQLGSGFGSVSIQECMNGYARVWAQVADPQPGMESAEQVYLKDAGGDWQVLTSGTGIDCQPPYLPAELQQACEALGLP